MTNAFQLRFTGGGEKKRVVDVLSDGPWTLRHLRTGTHQERTSDS